MLGQIARPQFPAHRTPLHVALATLIAAALVTGGWRVWSAEGDLADAEVRLRGVRAATVIDPGRVPRPAVEGESLARGAVVSTGAAGTATLEVRGRRVRLAPDTTVAVPDGAVTDLRRGSVLVDRRDGPEVSILAGAVTLDEVARGAVRVDRGFSVRVSVYSGGARVRTTDRRLDIPRLHQMAVAGRALPDQPTPLRLSGDDWEREVIPDVHAADVALARLARGLDADPRLATPDRLALLPAAYRGAVASLPVGATRSEALLPVAIGLAAEGADADDAIDEAGRLRRDGGSWGVVASLVRARSAAVSRQLANLLAEPGGDAVVAGEAPDGGLGGPDGTGPNTGPTSPSREPGPPAGPRPSGSTSPTPSPSSTVDQVVETIRSLLPTPGVPAVDASPSGSPAPTPQPSPQPDLVDLITSLLR